MKELKPRILFMGTPEFAVPILQMLLQEGYPVVGVVTQPDRPKGRKKILTPSPVKKLAVKHQLPVFQPQKLREPDSLQKIYQQSPDLIITAAYGQILPEALLKYPKHGCVNVHASLLPAYRGGAPIHWAMMNGEEETGVTIMYMVKALDAGDILSQRKTKILPTDDVGSLHIKLSHLGADLLKETLPLLLMGKITPVSQDETQVTYARNVTREDECIRWEKSAEQIVNQVRGLHPWPGAFTYWRGSPFKVWRATVGGLDVDTKEVPGMVIDIDTDQIIVASGSGTVILHEIQPAGKNRMRAQDFIRGAQMKVGEILGEQVGE